jgi:hypothetical protein
VYPSGHGEHKRLPFCSLHVVIESQAVGEHVVVLCG